MISLQSRLLMRALNRLVSDTVILLQAITMLLDKKRRQFELLIAQRRIGLQAYESRLQIAGQEALTLQIVDLQVSIVSLQDAKVGSPGTLFGILKAIGRAAKISVLKTKQSFLIWVLGSRLGKQASGDSQLPWWPRVEKARALSREIERLNENLRELRQQSSERLRRPLWIWGVGLALVAVWFVFSVREQNRSGETSQTHAIANGGQNAEENSRSQKSQIQAANGNPSSAHQWARLYQETRLISDQELLSYFPEVKLLVYPNSALSSYYTSDDLVRLFQEAVESQGIRIRDDSPVKLVIECSLQESAVKLQQLSSQFGRMDHTFPVNIKFVSLQFVVTTPVLRGGHFYSLDVAPLHGWSADMDQGEDDRDDRTKKFQELVGKVFNVIRKPGPDVKSEEEDAWKKTAWAPDQDQRLYEEYLRAIAIGPPESEKCFINFPRIACYNLSADDTARSNVNWNGYTRRWQQILNDGQHQLSSSDYVSLTHELHSVRTGANVAVKNLFGFESNPYFSNLSVVRISQANVVFPVSKSGEKPFLVRSKVLAFTTFAANMCLADDLEKSLEQVNLESMNDVAQQMRYRH